MKLKTIITSIFLTLIISSIADAAPYYRLWQGWKLDSIDYEGLRRGLDERFIPATVEVGMGRGLMSYLPALAPLPEKRPEVVRKLLPDEIALVVYDKARPMALCIGNTLTRIRAAKVHYRKNTWVNLNQLTPMMSWEVLNTGRMAMPFT
jgi:hypothetical protein